MENTFYKARNFFSEGALLKTTRRRLEAILLRGGYETKLISWVTM